MEDLASLAFSAVTAAAAYLTAKGIGIADKAVDIAGDKALRWLEEKLTSKGGVVALEQLRSEPDSKEAQEDLQGLLVGRLTGDRPLAAELSQLLRDQKIPLRQVNQTSTQSGTANQSTQIIGHGNAINVPGRREPST